MKKSKFKNERGSITLFVLLSILFFLIVIFSVFIASSNKEQSQTSEIDKIKQEYEKSVDNIDQIYMEELKGKQKKIEDLKIGDKVYYDTGNKRIGNNGIIECIVLYDKTYNDQKETNYGVQMISADVIYKDNEVDKVTLGETDNFNASREDYNNAFEILYNKAQEYLNVEDKSGMPVIATGVRCVGSKPDNPDWDTKEMFTSNYSYMTDYNNTLKLGEDWTNNPNWIEDSNNPDWTQMEYIYNIAKPTFSYWLSLRTIYSSAYSSDFYVPMALTYYDIYERNICGIQNKGSASIDNPYGNVNLYGVKNSYGIRPVFTLKSGVKLTAGDGVETPYTLGP